MSAKYEELVEAGAPRLPEGYYYKVYEWVDDFGRDELRVKVYRKRRCWFSKGLGREAVYSSQVRGAEDVARLCRIAWSKTEGLQLRPAAADFLGRHP